MSTFIRLSLSPFLKAPSDLISFGIGFSISVEQIRILTPINTFSTIQIQNPRKRTRNYVSSQEKSKRTRTLLIWIHEKEVILKNKSNIRHY